MPRRIFQGTVVSTKAAKTIVVQVATTNKHPVYGKTIRGTKRFHAHDVNSVCNMGDEVQIIECPPKSALKRFELLKRVKVAGELISDNADAACVLAATEGTAEEAQNG
jgi:small subunit ribosomal protein S17